MALTDGLNDHLFRGTFSNPNPLTCSDGKSEICGSPANISQGRHRFWHGARAPRRQTFWRMLPSVLGARSVSDTNSMMSKERGREEERLKWTFAGLGFEAGEFIYKRVMSYIVTSGELPPVRVTSKNPSIGTHLNDVDVICNTQTLPNLMDHNRLEERACLGRAVRNCTAQGRLPHPLRARRGGNRTILNEIQRQDPRSATRGLANHHLWAKTRVGGPPYGSNRRSLRPPFWGTF